MQSTLQARDGTAANVPTSAASDPRAAQVSWQLIPLASWWILFLMTMDHVLGMMDRNAVAILKTQIKEIFDIGDAEYSILVTAFMVPYAIFYVICGRLVDRYGTRICLTAFVAIWSLATILAGLSQTFPQLVATRVVLGAAEAGLLPCTIIALVTWFPREKLATVYAIKNPLQALGPILSPPVIAGIALAFGWRWAFIVPGAIGLVFAALWWISDRNPPKFPSSVAAPAPAERPSLMALLRHPLLWGVLLGRLISDPVWFFFQYWQSGYLQEVLGLSLAEVGQILWIPPLVNTIFIFATATWSDRLIARGATPLRSRLKVMSWMTILAPLMLLMPLTDDPMIFVALLTTTYILCFTWLYLTNILIADIFPKLMVGSVVGLVNCVGTIGAALFNAGVGPFIEVWGYVPVFIACALLHPVALIVMRRAYAPMLAADRASPAGSPA